MNKLRLAELASLNLFTKLMKLQSTWYIGNGKKY